MTLALQFDLLLAAVFVIDIRPLLCGPREPCAAVFVIEILPLSCDPRKPCAAVV